MQKIMVIKINGREIIGHPGEALGKDGHFCDLRTGAEYMLFDSEKKAKNYLINKSIERVRICAKGGDLSNFKFKKIECIKDVYYFRLFEEWKIKDRKDIQQQQKELRKEIEQIKTKNDRKFLCYKETKVHTKGKLHPKQHKLKPGYYRDYYII